MDPGKVVALRPRDRGFKYASEVEGEITSDLGRAQNDSNPTHLAIPTTHTHSETRMCIEMCVCVGVLCCVLLFIILPSLVVPTIRLVLSRYTGFRKTKCMKS